MSREMVDRLIIVDFGAINFNWFLVGILIVLVINSYVVWTVHPEVRASSWIGVIGVIASFMIILILAIGMKIHIKENNKYKLEDKFIEDFRGGLGIAGDEEIGMEQIGKEVYILLNGGYRYIIYPDKEETVWEKLEQ